MAILAYVLITGAVTFVLTTGIDGEARYELFKEGARPAVALFLLVWIVLYTLIHS